MANNKRGAGYTKEERETVILLNEADMEEGFFLLSTTNGHHAKTILKRLGGLSAPGVEFSRVERAGSSGVVALNAKIPLPYLAPKSFCLRSAAQIRSAQRNKGKRPGFGARTKLVPGK